MNKLYTCISHKGGTGRSVSTANIAYHLSKQGNKICLVDLDLASPTMGAVVGLDDIAAGADSGRGVHNVLTGTIPPEVVSELERDVWASDGLAGLRTFNCAELRLLPGTRGAGDMLLHRGSSHGAEERRRLGRILDDLLGRYDIVFCDLRSGIGPVADTFLRPPVAELVDAWILFHRWTHQHLAGAIDLARELDNASEISTKFLAVRTAWIDPASAPPDKRVWISKLNDELAREYDKLRLATKQEIEPLGTIPLETILQWRECILTEELERHAAAQDTVDAFGKIASRLATNQHQGIDR